LASTASETSVDFERITRRYIPEDRTLHNHRCENLKSHFRVFNICIRKQLPSRLVSRRTSLRHFNINDVSQQSYSGNVQLSRQTARNRVLLVYRRAQVRFLSFHVNAVVKLSMRRYALGRGSAHKKLAVITEVFLSPYRQMPVRSSNSATGPSFRIRSNSLFTSHPII
jgi:hypothetical protein